MGSGDTGEVSVGSPLLPSPEEWLCWRVEIVDELHAGKQSRVFDAVLDGQRVAVKLTESRLADRSVLVERLNAVASLGTDYPNVVPPIRIEDALVQPIGGWLQNSDHRYFYVNEFRQIGYFNSFPSWSTFCVKISSVNRIYFSKLVHVCNED